MAGRGFWRVHHTAKVQPAPNRDANSPECISHDIGEPCRASRTTDGARDPGEARALEWPAAGSGEVAPGGPFQAPHQELSAGTLAPGTRPLGGSSPCPHRPAIQDARGQGRWSELRRCRHL